MSFYNDNKELFLEPKVTQYGSHMVMTNVKKETKTSYINIDTRFRDEYNYSDPVNYNLTLPQRITDVKNIRVTNLELPMVYYNITNQIGNNKLYLTNTTSSTKYTITLADGYYSASTLTTEINAELTSAGITDVTFSVVNNKSRFTVSNSSNNNYVLSFNLNTLSPNTKDSNNNVIVTKGTPDWIYTKRQLGWLLGFRNSAKSYTLTKTIPVISNTFIDINGPRYLYLAIDEFSRGNQQSFVSPLNTSLINKNIIARISIDSTVGFANILSVNRMKGTLLSDCRCYTGKIDLLKLNIQLLDESGMNVSLYGFDFSFCLEVEHE